MTDDVVTLTRNEAAIILNQLEMWHDVVQPRADKIDPQLARLTELLTQKLTP
jgi:hypothetical protein